MQTNIDKNKKSLCRANAYGDLLVGVLAKSQLMGLLHLAVLCVCAFVFKRNCAKIYSKTPKKWLQKLVILAILREFFRSKFHFVGKIE